MDKPLTPDLFVYIIPPIILLQDPTDTTRAALRRPWPPEVRRGYRRRVGEALRKGWDRRHGSKRFGRTIRRKSDGGGRGAHELGKAATCSRGIVTGRPAESHN